MKTQLPNPCVLTIGKFEGIHLGHRALLEEVVRRAKSAGLASGVVVFDPHPFKLLRTPDYKPIFTPPERDALIRKTGIDHILPLTFDAEFAAKSAADFCREIFEKILPREIIVGENYRFGHNREGTIETLRNAAEESGCRVKVLAKTLGTLPPRNLLKKVDQNFNMEISTSRIRELLDENELEKAEQLLGFPFFISGEVTKGRQLGRTLGFPTMNIYPPADKFLLQNGVYETRVVFGNIPALLGITNIGFRPTVSENAQISVETHIPAALGEMYGRQIKVEFLRFIRPERRFENIRELQLQIKSDLHSLAKK